MTSGEEYEATIIGADEQNDVALIKIDATGLPTVSIGDSDDIEVGQQVCAIGNPLGELTNTLTVGYVSALDREINENGTPINMFQTDCAINSGNSGGPIFDMNGNVIGITTAKYSSSGSSTTASIEGIGFCIPSNDAMDIVSDLLEYGYVKGRPYLGITCQAISSTVTQYYNLPSGIYVNSVESGSAAEDAGLQQGDIITALDGTEVDSVTDFKALLKNYSAGDTATLTVYRSASGTVELSVTFGEQVTTTTSQTEETEEDTQDQQDQQQQQQPQQQNPWSYYGFGDMS
jgi:serine protease Do